MATSSLVLDPTSSHDGANERRWAAPGCISRAHTSKRASLVASAGTGRLHRPAFCRVPPPVPPDRCLRRRVKARAAQLVAQAGQPARPPVPAPGERRGLLCPGEPTTKRSRGVARGSTPQHPPVEARVGSALFRRTEDFAHLRLLPLPASAIVVSRLQTVVLGLGHKGRKGTCRA